MRKFATGVLVAMAVLALSAFIASRVDVTRASDSADAQSVQDAPDMSIVEDQVRVPDVAQLKGSAQAGDKEEGATKVSFVGIVLRPLPAPEAEELGIDGGIVVERVIEGAPASGNLEAGDVITAVGGETVTAVSEVVDKVRASEPGVVLVFTVVRDGETLDTSVTVGEREIQTITRHALTPDLRSEVFRHLSGLPEKFVKAEVVLETDDGFKTFRAVVGTPVSVDPDAGTFVLAPKDGSDPITYAISEDTSVNLTRKGDLSGLNTEDTTLVVDVDGEVKLVHQGDLPLGQMPFRGLQAVPGLRLPGIDRDHLPDLRRFEGLDNLRDRFPGLEGMDRFEERFRDALPEDLRERLERLRSGEGDLELDFRIQRLPGVGELICEEETSEGPPRRVMIRCSNEDIGDAQ